MLPVRNALELNLPDGQQKMNKMRELAEEYVTKHGRTGGSSLATIAAFEAGAKAARDWNAPLVKALEEKISNLENEVEYWHKLWQRAALASLPPATAPTGDKE